MTTYMKREEKLYQKDKAEWQVTFMELNPGVASIIGYYKHNIVIHS